MTIRKLVAHIIVEGTFPCSKISKTPAPNQEEAIETDSKDKLVGARKASFDCCTEPTAKLDDSLSSCGEPPGGGIVLYRCFVG
jgi:hypothetical protein